MTPSGRVMTITATFLVSLGCLLVALAVYANAKRLASETPVTATVAKVRSERGQSKGRELVYYAQLIFDRKQNDGNVIHCDVPNVFLGIQRVTVGATIMVAPRTTTCVAPDVICETCVAPSGHLALGLLIVGAVSGLICFFLVRNAVSEMQNKAV